jgi:hypothetical protein
MSWNENERERFGTRMGEGFEGFLSEKDVRENERGTEDFRDFGEKDRKKEMKNGKDKIFQNTRVESLKQNFTVIISVPPCLFSTSIIPKIRSGIFINELSINFSLQVESLPNYISLQV